MGLCYPKPVNNYIKYHPSLGKIIINIDGDPVKVDVNKFTTLGDLRNEVGRTIGCKHDDLIMTIVYPDNKYFNGPYDNKPLTSCSSGSTFYCSYLAYGRRCYHSNDPSDPKNV